MKNRLEISCADSAAKTTNETVSLAVYSEAIERPVRDYVKAHPEIQFMPLRISGAETGERPDQSSPDTPLRTCVDNHLAAMDYKDIADA